MKLYGPLTFYGQFGRIMQNYAFDGKANTNLSISRITLNMKRNIIIRKKILPNGQ